MKLIGRVLGGLAFAYDLISAVVGVALGVAIVVYGVIESRLAWVAIGAVIALGAGLWLVFVAWPDRRERQPESD